MHDNGSVDRYKKRSEVDASIWLGVERETSIRRWRDRPNPTWIERRARGRIGERRASATEISFGFSASSTAPGLYLGCGTRGRGDGEGAGGLEERRRLEDESTALCRSGRIEE
jgi:hypothetical protein